MKKYRTELNEVFTPMEKRSFPDGTVLTIATNGMNDEALEKDDGRRLKVSLYGDNINMTGLYKHGFTIEANGTEQVFKLKTYLTFLVMRINELLAVYNEPPHWTQQSPYYNSDSARQYIIDDIYDTESLDELEDIMKSCKGWANHEEIQSAYQKQSEKLNSEATHTSQVKFLKEQKYIH